VIGVRIKTPIRAGQNLDELIADSCRAQGVKLQPGDVVVISQKIVSKAEGRVVDLSKVKPSPLAIKIAKLFGGDARRLEVILSESRRIVRMDAGHLIVETDHGFICANAGVDRSNVEGKNAVTLLPKDPDRSAERIRRGLLKRTGVRVPVIISDTFGRPWRIGQVNFAIGVAGMKPIIDYRGRRDMFRHTLKVTMIAVADELASAAELEMNKADGIPVAIIRGYNYPRGRGSAKQLLRAREEDLFR
jgi:coenzyme F420-0:L-glutamate ligase/coenzyme F420-1:gamma-L-glutamate ligase